MLAEIVFIIGISLVQDRVSFLATSYTECENTIQPNIMDKMRKRSSDWFIQSYRYSRNKILAYKDETLKKKLINLEKKNNVILGLSWILCTDFVRSGCGTPSLPVSGGLRLDVSGGLPVVRDVDWGVRGWEEPQEVVLPVWLWHSLGYCCRDSRSEAIRIWNRQAVSQDVWYRSMNIDLRGKMSILSELKRIKCTLKLLVCVQECVIG